MWCRGIQLVSIGLKELLDPRYNNILFLKIRFAEKPYQLHEKIIFTLWTDSEKNSWKWLVQFCFSFFHRWDSGSLRKYEKVQAIFISLAKPTLGIFICLLIFDRLFSIIFREISKNKNNFSVKKNWNHGRFVISRYCTYKKYKTEIVHSDKILLKVKN